MICYRCKKKIADDAKFCPECGMATKLVTEAPTETITLPPDLEELPPAPAPVKPERKLELPKVELPKVELPKIKKEKPEPEVPVQKEPAPVEPEAPKARGWLPFVLGVAFAALVIALVFGLRGGDAPEEPITPPVISEPVVEPIQPAEFADAALWHAEKGESFPFTHAFDAAVYDGYRLQDYSQKYMEPAEAAALFETYFTTYLEGELGFKRTGEQAVEMSVLPWQYVWFEHPDERVQGFHVSEMNRALTEGNCDLAYAFQFGADGNLLVSCYYSDALSMRAGELPKVEPLQPRIRFDDFAVWYAENNINKRYWRIGEPEKTVDSYKQRYGTDDTNTRTIARLFERYFDSSLSKQGFQMVGSKIYQDDEVELGYYWFDYTGGRALEGFRYNNHTAAHTVYNCDLVYGYYVYRDGTVEIHSYFDKELAQSDSEFVVTVDPNGVGGNDSASAGQPDGPMAPEDIPVGTIPEIGAFSRDAFTLISDVATRESTTLQYNGLADLELFQSYIDLLQYQYGFRVVEKVESERGFFNQFTYTLVYDGAAAVENFKYDQNMVSLVVKYWSIGHSGDLEMVYARGLQTMDAGDRV